VRGGGGTAKYSIPFVASPVWTYSPDGRFFGGLPDRYSILVVGKDQVHRVDRSMAPVRISSQERDDMRNMMVANIRRGNDAAFTWNGAGMPTVKPYFDRIVVDDEQRIWVRVATPSVRHAPESPNAPATYRSPVVYDVYDHSLRFLGTLRFSDSFTLHQARGTQIWGTELDEDGVPIVVRYRRDGTSR